jgi:hypothetical protein
MLLSDNKRPSTKDLIYERLTDRLVKELVVFAIRRSKELTWRRGSAMELPGGETPQSIVSLAIVRAAEGTRQWNPKTHPDLSLYLKGVIRSLLNHLATSRENTLFAAAPGSEDQDAPAWDAGANMTELDGAEWLARAPITPEDELLAGERLNAEEWAENILDQAAREDAEVSAVIRAMRDGCDPRKDIEIADETGLAIEEVRKAKKRLNRLIDKVAAQVRGTAAGRRITSRTAQE